MMPACQGSDSGLEHYASGESSFLPCVLWARVVGYCCCLFASFVPSQKVWGGFGVLFAPRNMLPTKVSDKFKDGLLWPNSQVTELKQFVCSLTQKFSSSLNTKKQFWGGSPCPNFHLFVNFVILGYKPRTFCMGLGCSLIIWCRPARVPTPLWSTMQVASHLFCPVCYEPG